MGTNTFNWTTSDGLEIYAKSWPVDHPKAIISIVHGIGEHIGRYDHMASYYNQANIAVIGNDHRGHGKSAGKRGHAPSLELLLDEVECLVVESKKRFPEVPHFLFGQSLGGNLALRYTLARKSDFAGIIASSPWVQLAFRPNPISLSIGKLLRGILPSLTLPTELDTTHLSTDPKVGTIYAADPLVHDKVSAALGIEMLHAADFLNQYTGSFPVPLLMMHGMADQIVSPQAAQAFAERVKGDVTFIPWEGLYHELHNEVCKEEIMDTTLAWLETKI